MAKHTGHHVKKTGGERGESGAAEDRRFLVLNYSRGLMAFLTDPDGLIALYQSWV